MVNGITKYLCLTGLLLLANVLLAQYQVKVANWTHDVKDLSQRSSKVLDQNGERCALIKFETPIPGAFSFDLGAQQIEKRENKDDEIWLWVSADVRKMTIRCTDCSPLKDYRVSLKAGNVYHVKVTTGLPQETSTHQNMNIYCEQVPFRISIDGAAPVLNESKNYYAELPVGEHEILITSKLYKPYSGKVRLYRSHPLNDTIRLQENYGEIIINCSQADYTVRVDEEEYPAGPIHVEPGTHKVTVVKDRYENFEANVEVQVHAKTEVAANLKPAFAVFNIIPADDDIEIWVDDKYRGHNNITIELRWGEHKIEGRRMGYDTWEYTNHDFNASSPRTIRIPRLNRQYGAIRVSFYPTDALVFVDGKEVIADRGVYVDNHVPTGSHFVQIRKTDFKTERDSFTVVSGKAFTRDYQLQHIPHGIVSISTDDDIAIYRWNESEDMSYYLARGSYTGKLPVGRNVITLENMNNVACQYSLFVNEGEDNPAYKFPYIRKLMVRSNVFGRPTVHLQSDVSSFDIKSNTKVKVEPQKYQLTVTKKGYVPYVDSVDLSVPGVKKLIYNANLQREGDTVRATRKVNRSPLIQRFYDNAGTWFLGIIDFGYTYSFYDTAHLVTAGILPFRYKLFTASLLDLEMRVTGHATDTVVKTLSYKPKVGVVLPCGEGFAFTFYTGMTLNLYEAFRKVNPGETKPKPTMHVLGGASMLVNGVGAFPMNIFAEYRVPVLGMDMPTSRKEQLFRVGINFAVGIDR